MFYSILTVILCVPGELGEQQWGVTYTTDSVCALEGSSVDLSCSYKQPGGLTVTESFWFINEQRGVEPEDLRDDDQYKGRVQYYQTQNQNQLYHTVRIAGLKASDSQTYKFRFITDDPGGKYTGRSGVSLSVTGSSESNKTNTQEGGKQLTCSSTCVLTNPTYIWYRNGQPVSEQNRAVLYLRDRTVDAGSYSCAVKGHEEIRSAAVYSPKDTRAVIVPSGERKEGDSVTLTCSSDADPPVLTFNWFKQRPAANESLGTGQNYSITSISSQHSGLYYCTALNQLGQHSSAPARLDVFYSPKDTRADVLPSGETVEGDSVTLTCSSDADPPVLTFNWFKQRPAADESLGTGQNYSITNISSQHSGLYYCTALNQLGQHSSAPARLDVFYSPKDTRAVVLPSGERKEGDSVTLTCSSDADPPVLTFYWFKQSVNESLGTGQNFSITNISSQHSGLYYCTALNQLGQHSSAPARLDVFCKCSLFCMILFLLSVRSSVIR
ncbi:sialoadhesin-like isoform X1 [Astyanax mexicanus]|uniref:Sialoadhesin-like isoform X1 n=1 Tax=Astyanax mexicanus TaxID=7994 RepID=A0A8T2LLR1_ASTMX|nr:sialoadhesin-like isoform X1 [Astyanax mexicanus]